MDGVALSAPVRYCRRRRRSEHWRYHGVPEGRYGLGVTVEVVTDVLGEPYTCRTIALKDDDEGPVSATLVACRASQPTGAAVL